MTVLTCKGVSFRYGRREAVRGIDVELCAGEVVCVLGPNGAGKTTLMRLITGDLKPSEGHVRVGTVDVHESPSAAKTRMGIVPQDAGVFRNLTVAEHLEYFARLKGITRENAEQAADLAIQECSLGELRDVKAGHLSGGQQRKLLMSLALLGDPMILVLDEPSVGLDPIARRELWRTVERQRAAGKSILLTTHYLDEAERLSNRVAFIRDGRISHQAPLEEFFDMVGSALKLTELDGETGAVRAQAYFNSVADAQAFALEHGFQSYSISRVSLEDAYLRLVGSDLAKEQRP